MHKKILIIEDDTDLLGLCTTILKKHGFEISVASDPSEGTKIFSKDEFGLVIIDVSLPGIDGIRLFENLKKEKGDISGILIVSQEPIEIAIRAIEKGFSRILKKPFSPEQLVSAVKECISQISIIEENIKLKTLIPLYELIERFIKAESEQEILEELVDAIKRHIGAERISVMIYDEKEGVLRIRAATGLDQEIIKKTKIRPGEMISGWVFKNKKPLILNDHFSEYSEIRPFLKRKDIISAISVPIMSIPMYAREKSIGVLNISKTKNRKTFTHSDMEMVFVICRQAAMAIENIRSIEEKTEKVRIRTILEQYMTHEIAELIISSGQDPIELGEIRKAIILFADIKEFTPLVQRIPIHTTRYFLNEFFAMLTELIFKFHGTLNKFIGDAALAIFGFPITIEKPEGAAIYAAMEIRKGFDMLKKKWEKKEKAFCNIGIGIGITSGEVFIGNVGSPKRFDFTVVGPDVNLAQRLASDTENGQILISNKVKEQIDNEFITKEKGQHYLKGINGPISVYTIMEE